MTDRPIIFSGSMVRALLAGRKTQTRRLLSPRPSLARPDRFQMVGTDKATGRAVWEAWAGGQPCSAFPAGANCCTPIFHTAAVGDRLYVREQFSVEPDGHGSTRVIYAADDADAHVDLTGNVERIAQADRLWLDPEYTRPSIHMPRWASRLTLIVQAVRVEPLQAITADDAWAEGVCVAVEEGGRGSFGQAPDDMRRMLVETIYGSGRTAFHWLWSTLHTKPGERWDDNPAVVALTFRVLRGNIDEVRA